MMKDEVDAFVMLGDLQLVDDRLASVQVRGSHD